MTTCRGNSCSFGLPRVPFVNCCQFMYLIISLLVLRAGYGIWLFIAYRFTLGKKLVHKSIKTSHTRTDIIKSLVTSIVLIKRTCLSQCKCQVQLHVFVFWIATVRAWILRMPGRRPAFDSPAGLATASSQSYPHKARVTPNLSCLPCLFSFFLRWYFDSLVCLILGFSRRQRLSVTTTIMTITWAVTWQNQQSDCAASEDSDQPGHPPSLIRVFAVRVKKPWVLSYPLRAQRRLWSDWANDLILPWAHTHFVGFVMSRLTFQLETLVSFHPGFPSFNWDTLMWGLSERLFFYFSYRKICYVAIFPSWIKELSPFSQNWLPHENGHTISCVFIFTF